MPLQPRLELSQGQEQKQLQVLDARQLQSLKIMQKPLQELREDIRAELETNPVLEEVPLPGPELAAPSLAARPDEDSGDTENDRTSDDYSDEIDRYEDTLAEDGDRATSASASEASDRHARFVESLADRSSLQSRLLEQLAEEALPEPVRRAGEYLVGSMDSDGRADLSAEELARAAGVSPEAAAEAIRTVREFDYGPARADDSGISFLVPEVAIVRAPGGGYTAELLPGTLPALRIAKMYRTLAGDADTDPEAKKYLAEKLRSGEFWIGALARRNATLLAIAKEIARLQGPFFDHGLAQLKPMTLAGMGEILGLHETTIGRAIDNKSALTPQGTCPLRLFFTHAVHKAPSPATDSGPAALDSPADASGVSTLAVKAALRQLVRGESPRHPLSDQALTDALKAQGYPVARRTVAKYREQLGIPPSHLRK
jgi:DNA-directed RNA polymerase specialized sigma54-like protein